MTVEFHEAANIFPLDEEHLDSLAADIRRRGLEVPIERLDGKILDGRRRWLACQRAGVTPKFLDVTVDDPVAHVLSHNLHRRHLTPSQKAMVAARARAIYDRRAAAAQKEAASRGGKASGASRRGEAKVQENFPEPSPGQARDQVGKDVGVSGKTVDYATKVLNNAVPEVIKAVDEGRMAVSTAAILSSEPEEVQRKEAIGPKRRRRYMPGPNGAARVPRQAPSEEPPPGEVRGVGVFRANEAINCLTRIPKNDPLRKRGFQIVTDWIRHNR